MPGQGQMATAKIRRTPIHRGSDFNASLIYLLSHLAGAVRIRPSGRGMKILLNESRDFHHLHGTKDPPEQLLLGQRIVFPHRPMACERFPTTATLFRAPLVTPEILNFSLRRRRGKRTCQNHAGHKPALSERFTFLRKSGVENLQKTHNQHLEDKFRFFGCARYSAASGAIKWRSWLPILTTTPEPPTRVR